MHSVFGGLCVWMSSMAFTLKDAYETLFIEFLFFSLNEEDFSAAV